ncbi:hypothetical protein [Psychromonas sp. SR45-3]|uniref:hypothetical protein n=1 Tax=Psychromonas sp. SR45-3 TaxID=2760930 RepID=UPI0015FAA62C|nr:hypothetical protein [Psychromonas sp. SR45-3]MBB1274926.1 hypothetical protein [Psychromonas sp. SR45-3]
MIFLVLVLCALAFFSYATEGCEPFNFRRILATILITIYGVIYFYVPPFLGMNNRYAGQLFELFPVCCYVVVLYTDEYPTLEKKIIMWLACIFWLAIFLLLSYFKMYYW